MRSLLLFVLIIMGCSTVPAKYVERVEKLERVADSLRKEIARLNEEAERLKKSLEPTERYYKEIYNYVYNEYERRGSEYRPIKAK